MRYFNTSGPNIIAEHYTLLRPQLVQTGLEKVENSRYFTIWAPRQTGKSTYFELLALNTATYLVFVNSEVTHKDVLEAVDVVDDVTVTTYLVRFDFETSFYPPLSINNRKGDKILNMRTLSPLEYFIPH